MGIARIRLNGFPKLKALHADAPRRKEAVVSSLPDFVSVAKINPC